MTPKKIKQNQTILDVSIQHTGKVDSFIDLMIKNGIDDIKAPEESVIVIDDSISDKSVVDFFQNNDAPATNNNVYQPIDPPQVSVPDPNPQESEGWVRNPEWLELEDISDSPQTFISLVAINPNGRNQIQLRVTCPNGFTVDWGDGNVINYNSDSFANHSYDFNTISPTTETSIGYRQVIIKVTPSNPNNVFNGTFWWNVNPNKVHNYLDISVNIPNINNIQGNCTAPMLERFVFFGLTPEANFTNAFVKCTALKVLEMDFSKPTNLSNFCSQTNLDSLPDLSIDNSTSMFKITRTFSIKEIGNISFPGLYFNGLNLSAVKKIGNVNIPNSVSAHSALLECHSLEHIGEINMPNVTVATYMFQNCNLLKSVKINSDSLSNGINMFYSCFSIEKIEFSDASSITSANSMFTFCNNLSSLKIPGMGVSFDVSNTNLDAPAIEIVFNDLKDLTGSTSQSISIVGTPGVANLSQSQKDIALNKNWTLIE